MTTPPNPEKENGIGQKNKEMAGGQSCINPFETPCMYCREPGGKFNSPDPIVVDRRLTPISPDCRAVFLRRQTRDPQRSSCMWEGHSELAEPFLHARAITQPFLHAERRAKQDPPSQPRSSHNYFCEPHPPSTSVCGLLARNPGRRGFCLLGTFGLLVVMVVVGIKTQLLHGWLVNAKT